MRITEINALPKYGNQTVPKSISGIAPGDEKQGYAVHWYRGRGHSPINAQLRGHDPQWPRGDDDEMLGDYGFVMSTEEGIENIDRVIASAPKRARSIKLFRGEENSHHAKKLLSMEVGQSYTDPGFVSTTVDPSRAFYSFSQRFRERGEGSNMLSMFIVPPSVPAAHFHLPDDDEDVEQEIVISRNCIFTLREKKVIPVRNRGYPVREIALLVWNVSPPK